MQGIEVAYLGPLGTYTHQAAHQYFGQSAKYIKQDTISDVFDAVLSDAPFGVVPQENTIFGSVIETYDLLRRANVGKDIFVVGEVTLGVQHCLLARKGVSVNEVEKVLSHEQALGQCQRFLSSHLPYAAKVKMSSTAAAAEALLTPGYAKSAAICSKLCVTVFDGLEALQEGIQDTNDNYTRFYVIGTEPIVVEPTLLTRRALIRLASITSGKNDLLTILSVLALKISRIDRRPSLQGGPFQDNYFIEVQEEEGHQCNHDCKPEAWANALRNAIHRITKIGGSACLLGSWQC